MFQYVYVPVELCFFAFRNRFVRQLQLFVYLKSICDGHLTIDSQEQERIAKELGLNSSRAIRNNLKGLINRNWIGYNRQSKRYYLRSYNTIHRMENFTSYTRAEFDIAEIQKFKAFAAGAVMCKLTNKQRSKMWREVRKMGVQFNPVTLTTLLLYLHLPRY